MVEQGTFGAAADHLGVTQPAVSYRIARLEEEMGTPLFERAGRRMVLTVAGRALQELAARHMSELDALRGSVSDTPVPSGEPLRIASVSGFGRYVLFPVLASPAFRDLPMELLFHTAEEVFRRVEAAEAELGVVYLPKISSYLDVRELCREELALIAPAAGPPEAPPCAPDDLEALPFVTYVESGYVFGAWFEHHFGRQPARIRTAHRFEELEEVVEMVALGQGLSVVPLDCAGAALDAGRIRVVPPAGPPCLNAVHAVTRSGAFVREELREVLAAVEERGGRRSTGWRAGDGRASDRRA